MRLFKRKLNWKWIKNRLKLERHHLRTEQQHKKNIQYYNKLRIEWKSLQPYLPNIGDALLINNIKVYVAYYDSCDKNNVTLIHYDTNEHKCSYEWPSFMICRSIKKGSIINTTMDTSETTMVDRQFNNEYDKLDGE